MIQISKRQKRIADKLRGDKPVVNKVINQNPYSPTNLNPPEGINKPYVKQYDKNGKVVNQITVINPYKHSIYTPYISREARRNNGKKHQDSFIQAVPVFLVKGDLSEEVMKKNRIYVGDNEKNYLTQDGVRILKGFKKVYHSKAALRRAQKELFVNHTSRNN